MAALSHLFPDPLVCVRHTKVTCMGCNNEMSSSVRESFEVMYIFLFHFFHVVLSGIFCLANNLANSL